MWEVGEKRLAGDSVKQQRTDERERLSKKRRMKRAIEKLQLEKKGKDTFEEERRVNVPGCTQRMMKKHPDYYS